MAEKPEQSRYLQYLPAIFRKDPSRPDSSFLGEFLLAFEGVLSDYQDLLSVIDRYIDAQLTAEDFLTWLFNWVALTLDENWDEATRRKLIAQAMALHRTRGTVSGLRQFLEIYNDRYEVQVREGRWPGGMQIGVASRIGGFSAVSPVDQIDGIVRRDPAIYCDYYIVETFAPADHPRLEEGQPLERHYAADQVKRVEVKPENGNLRVLLESLDGETFDHLATSVRRRDGIIEDLYTLATGADTVEFRGDTFLVDSVEHPYRFIIDIGVTPEDWQEDRRPAKIRSIDSIVREVKPAHAMHYLRLTENVTEPALQVMQIGVRSTIGVDRAITIG